MEARGMPGRIPRVILDSSTAASSTPSFKSAQAPSPSNPPKPRITMASFRFLLDFGPGIAQRHGAVEHQLMRSGIAIHAEVAEPLELITAAGCRAGQARLQLAVGKNFERVRIQIIGELSALRDVVRIFLG